MMMILIQVLMIMMMRTIDFRQTSGQDMPLCVSSGTFLCARAGID